MTVGAAAGWATGSTLRRALIAAPLVYAAHNLEESVAMVRWAARDLPLLLEEIRGASAPELLPPGAADLLQHLQPPTAQQFWIAAAVATILPAALCGLALARGPASGWTRAAVWLQALFCVNVFIPHLAGSLWLRRYTPGVVTAVVLNLPLSLAVFRGALTERVITRRALTVFAVSALAACAVLVALLLALRHVAAGLGTGL